ncbi:MAG: apolipoprotein N-acyltransferase [Lentisphaerae bacterium]|nr:apolipoprotein N-acyltransferase [Lentisphaerota bacterium]
MAEVKNQAWQISTRRRLCWLLFSFAGGMLYAAALPPLNWSFAVFFCLFPVLYCGNVFKWKFAWLSGWCWGLGWAFFSYRFLREIEWFVPWLLAPVMALWPAFWGALLPKLREWMIFPADSVQWNCREKEEYLIRRLPWYRVLAFAISAALLFTLIEWTRSRLFVWNDFSVTQWRNTAFIQISSLTGSYGIGFLIAWFNTAFFSAVIFRKRGTWQTIPVILTFIAVLAFGFRRLSRLEKNSEPARTLRAGLVQCDLSQRRHATESQILEAIEVCTSLSRQLAAQKPDIIIWPESAVPIPLNSGGYAGTVFRQKFSALLKDTGIPLLAGMLAFREDNSANSWQITNSALLFDIKKRSAERYDKIHRVPYGEYVPFRKYLPEALVNAVDMGRDLAPGNNYEPFTLDSGIRVSTAICYEGVFGYLIRQFALRRTNLLIVLSNDAWYPESSEPEQHLANAVIRSVESGLYMIRCGNNGGSGVVTPAGKFISYIGSSAPRPELLRERAYGVVEVPVPRSSEYRTIFVKYGEWFILLLAAGLFSIIVYGVIMERNRRNIALQIIKKEKS